MDNPEFFNSLSKHYPKFTKKPAWRDDTQFIVDNLKGWTLQEVAYALATIFHETAYSMKPIMENGGPNYFKKMYDIQGSRPALAKRMGNTTPGDGVKYCGRGYVQLTWKNNYVLLGDELGIDLVNEPDLAMRPENAILILKVGMKRGLYTGKSFKTYTKAGTLNYREARRIINGVDKAAEIAAHAEKFAEALEDGGWGEVHEQNEFYMKPAPLLNVIEVKNDPVSMSSRTAQGSGVGLTSGVLLAVGSQSKELTETASSISSNIGIPVVTLLGIAIVLGCSYAVYARWRDGGGLFPWERGKA